MNNKLNKNRNTFDHYLSRCATNHLEMHHMFMNIICIQFCKNWMNNYRIINILLQNAVFFSRTFILIEIPKFKTNKVNIQRDLDVCNNYFLTVHATIVVKKLSNVFTIITWIVLGLWEYVKYIHLHIYWKICLSGI